MGDHILTYFFFLSF